MITADVVRAISKKNNISQVLAKRLLNAHIQNITEQLAKGNRVILKGFGSFSVKHLAKRKAWIPSKNKFQIVKAKNSLRFHPATKLKQELNEESSND